MIRRRLGTRDDGSKVVAEFPRNALTGALSNHDSANVLRKLLDWKRRAMHTSKSEAVLGQLIRPPQGAIQAAVLEVLRGAPCSLHVAEIHKGVEDELGRAVSRDTVASFLSVACRAGAPVVLRVERGVYAVDR
jgi:hypothetical protein